MQLPVRPRQEDVRQLSSGVVPAQAGTNTPQQSEVAALTITETLVVMGPRLRGDDRRLGLCQGYLSALNSRFRRCEAITLRCRPRAGGDPYAAAKRCGGANDN